MIQSNIQNIHHYCTYISNVYFVRLIENPMLRGIKKVRNNK